MAATVRAFLLTMGLGAAFACACGGSTDGGEGPADATAPPADVAPPRGLFCGTAGDGCGGILDCTHAACPVGLTCNGCVCVSPTAPQCEGTPRTCAQVGANCGFITDGVGGIVDCGTCPPGEECGAQAENQCGVCADGGTDAGDGGD